jgi:hypothetical protein
VRVSISLCIIITGVLEETGCITQHYFPTITESTLQKSGSSLLYVYKQIQDLGLPLQLVMMKKQLEHICFFALMDFVTKCSLWSKTQLVTSVAMICSKNLLTWRNQHQIKKAHLKNA